MNRTRIYTKQQQEIERIGRDVARPAAAHVDIAGRFPRETIDALRAAHILGAAVPRELGGGGLNVLDLSAQCIELGRHCASSAMILAMHHIQVASIARHHRNVPALVDYLRCVQSEQRLIASVTSEVGPNGDMRRSQCAVQTLDGHSSLTKDATTISYGEHADDLLITARRNGAAAPNDQVAVLARRGEYTLEPRGEWDTLGMRGTCSPPALVSWQGASDAILPDAFAIIASETMVPYSHILWASCWLGIASDTRAVAGRAVRVRARHNPGSTPPEARALSELSAKLQTMQNNVNDVAREYAATVAANDQETLSSIAFAIRLNNLKLLASEAVVEIVTGALRICGISAYKNGGELSLGRHLRDAHSAALMISNERIHATNAALLLVHKGN